MLLLTNAFYFLHTLAMRIRALLPGRLPRGRAEFMKWADKLIRIYGLPDNDSVRFAIGGIIINAKPWAFYMPMEYFGWLLMKGAANQVAGTLMKEWHDAKQARALEEKQAEATAISKAGTSVEPIQG